MVESDGIGKSTSGEPGAGEAAQALRAILQTQYLRYMIISTWALGLLATVGFTSAALWFVGTIAAGAIPRRGREADQRSGRLGLGARLPGRRDRDHRRLGRRAPDRLVFRPSVRPRPSPRPCWSAAMCWCSRSCAPRPARRWLSPRPTASPPRSSSSACGAARSSGPSWPSCRSRPRVLVVLVMMTMLREERIRAFQEHQAHLIEELEAARDKANAASDAKSNFLGGHFARTAHADERGAGRRPAAGRHAPGANPARLSVDHPQLGRQSAEPAERHPRHDQDRGRQDDLRDRRCDDRGPAQAGDRALPGPGRAPRA
jgi:hypothetical protein